MAYELGEWLLTECARRDLSFREASRRAGIANNGVSEIINGSRPSLSRIHKLARFFNVSPEFLIRLDGGLPTAAEQPNIPRMAELAERLAMIPPERQERVMRALLVLLDVMDVTDATRVLQPTERDNPGHP